MKAVLTKIELSFAVTAAAKALGTSNLNGDYGSLNIVADGNRVRFTANNGETTVTANASAEIVEEGNVATDGKLFVEAVKKITDEEITIEEADKRLNLKYKGGCLKLPLLTFNQMPLENDAAEAAFVISVSAFNDTVSRVQAFCAKDDSHRYLKGVNFKTNGGSLTAVGCDGFRLAKIVTQIEKEGGKDINITVPLTALQIISSLADKSNDRLEILLSKNGNVLRVKQDIITITSVLYGEAYLNYNNIIPSTFTSSVEVNKTEFTYAIERSTVVSETTNKTVKLTVSPLALEISTESNTGALVEEIDATMSGKEFVIGFNAKFLMDVLKCLKADKVKLQANGSTKPVVIEEKNALYLILPLNLGVKTK